MTEQQLERFHAKIKREGPDECWEWQGARFAAGYGQFNLGGKLKVASRIAWQLVNGPIPDGRWILHKCDNPPCCNPDHLKLGGPKENVQDMLERGRTRPRSGDNHPWKLKPELIPRGERAGQSKLTDVQVMEIRERHLKGEACSCLAKSYEMSVTEITRIVRGEAWTHLPVLGEPAVARGVKQVRLSEETVRHIHEQLTKGVSRKEVANELGVSYECVAGIAGGPNWAHLGLEFPKGKAKGTKNANAVLTDEKVIEMRTLYDDGQATIANLAAQFGTAWITARNVVQRRTWRHI